MRRRARGSAPLAGGRTVGGRDTGHRAPRRPPRDRAWTDHFLDEEARAPIFFAGKSRARPLLRAVRRLGGTGTPVWDGRRGLEVAPGISPGEIVRWVGRSRLRDRLSLPARLSLGVLGDYGVLASYVRERMHIR